MCQKYKHGGSWKEGMRGGALRKAESADQQMGGGEKSNLSFTNLASSNLPQPFRVPRENEL